MIINSQKNAGMLFCKGCLEHLFTFNSQTLCLNLSISDDNTVAFQTD